MTTLKRLTAWLLLLLELLLAALATGAFLTAGD